MAGRNTTANSRQVGGSHYKKSGGMQHWDVVVAMNWDYFQAQISRYIDRHDKKNGLEDLQKAQHYLDKYIEVRYAKELTAQRKKAADNKIAAGKKPKKGIDLDRGFVTPATASLLTVSGSDDFLKDEGRRFAPIAKRPIRQRRVSKLSRKSRAK